jgi:Cu+-exporting ATPase
MVGDGINDAPALAAAPSASHSAAAPMWQWKRQIDLMRSDPRLVPAAIDIAWITVGKIRRTVLGSSSTSSGFQWRLSGFSRRLWPAP